MQVIKSDGSQQNYRVFKIERAICKILKESVKEEELDARDLPKELSSVQDTYKSESKRLAKLVDEDVKYFLKDKECVHVDEIQSIVTRILLDYYPKAAVCAIEFRKQSKEGLEYLDYMDAYVSSRDNAATSSQSDPNANVAIKNAANLEGEVYKMRNRNIQRRRIRKKLREMYPAEDLADLYMTDLTSKVTYVHDEASSPVIKNYCEAVTLHPLLMDGTNSLDGTGNVAPKRLSSFQGQIVNLAFLLASQCKGAVAFGEFFNAMDYFCVKDFGPDYPKFDNEYVDTELVINRQTLGEKIEQIFQGIVHGWNQPSGNRCYQSPFTNISYYDKYYWHALFDEYTFPDGTKPSWERVSYLQKKFMKWFNKERTKTVLTFPVETMALLTDENGFKDHDYENFTAEMYAEGHSFFTFMSDNADSLSSCCRLRNKLTTNTFHMSTGLTGVQTGSCNVITLNLARITQNWARKVSGCNDSFAIMQTPYLMSSVLDALYSDENSLKEYISEIVERVHKYHIAYKTMLYEFEEAGMLTPSNAGYIKMINLYSTVGLNGVNEAARFLGMSISYNEEYKKFCRMITGTISELNAKNSTPRFRFNTEFVPAEGLSSKNYNWDKADGYWVPEDKNLYNSYFYDAHDPHTTIFEKFKLHGREFTELLDGGVGLHLNLEEHPTKEQALHMMHYARKWGCNYWTINVPISKCKDCGHIVKAPVKQCPKCGSVHIDWWTRIIGFLRPLSNFDIYRFKEAQNRYYANVKIDISNLERKAM